MTAPVVVRSPRRIDVAALEQAGVTTSDTPPPVDSLSWRLWLACSDLATAALETIYIQGIGGGTLPPCRYGQYTVQDAVYCYHAENDYKIIEKNALAAGESALAAFAAARYAGYVPYTRSIMDAWHIQHITAIDPNAAVTGYIAHEHHVATELDPIYGVIAMIPCDQLWAWLATQLASDVRPGNVYDFWITGNADWSGAYRLDNFVDAWAAAHPDTVEWSTALAAYRGSMLGEVNDFRAATGQPPLT